MKFRFINSMPRFIAGPGQTVGLSAFRLLVVATELKAHRRQELVGKIVFTPGSETVVKGRGEQGCWCAGLDGGDAGPPPLAQVGDPAGEIRQIRIGMQRVGGPVRNAG